MKIECNLIKYNTPDSKGDIILPDAITFNNLTQLKIKGEILDHQIREDGIRIIKDFKFKSVSV